MQDPGPKVAIVAGAGSGIGRGCALRLAAMGYRVILVGRSEDKLAAVAASIAETGGVSVVFPADVRDWDRLGELQAQVADEGVDLLINSAGGQFYKPASELSPNGWRAVIEVNLSGCFFLCRQLYPSLRKRRGSVVNVVANLWQRPAPGMVHSAAARGGIVSLTRTLALEWAADRIRVNALSPGLTDTPALHGYPHVESVFGAVPLGRIGTVEEVADAILFLAHAPYITGEVLTVDGGLHLR